MSQQTPRRYAKHKRNPSANKVSDYESDAPYVVDTTPNPTLARRTNTEINLKVLRSYLADVTHINYCNSHAVVYHLDTAQSQWAKTTIEGALFICQSDLSTSTSTSTSTSIGPHPTYYLFILNRKNTENRVYSFDEIVEMEVSGDYLMLQVDGHDEDTVGIWMHATSDHERSESMEKIIGIFKEFKMAHPHQSQQQPPQQQQQQLQQQQFQQQQQQQFQMQSMEAYHQQMQMQQQMHQQQQYQAYQEHPQLQQLQHQLQQQHQHQHQNQNQHQHHQQQHYQGQYPNQYPSGLQVDVQSLFR